MSTEKQNVYREIKSLDKQRYLKEIKSLRTRGYFMINGRKSNEIHQEMKQGKTKLLRKKRYHKFEEE